MVTCCGQSLGADSDDEDLVAIYAIESDAVDGSTWLPAFPVYPAVIPDSMTLVETNQHAALLFTDTGAPVFLSDF
jgi:hypothetical protein